MSNHDDRYKCPECGWELRERQVRRGVHCPKCWNERLNRGYAVGFGLAVVIGLLSRSFIVGFFVFFAVYVFTRLRATFC